MELQYATIDNKKIGYHVIGKGNPVILLHGFAEDNNVWKHQLTALSSSFKLIIPDLPGSGVSEIISDMSIEGLADAIYQLVISILGNNTPVTIIGHSMGGYITLALAEKYPDTCRAIGLFHSTAYADNDEKKQARQRSIVFIRKHGSYAFLQQSIPNLFAEKYRNENSDKISNMIEQYKDFDDLALTSYYESMIARPERTNLLMNFNKPILFIAGKLDKAVPFEDSIRQCQLPQLSYIHALENSSHMGMWEEAGKANRALMEFLEDVQQ